MTTKHTKKILLVLVVVLVATILVSAVAYADPPAGNKLTICHTQTKDKGDQPAGDYTQEVSWSSWLKHHEKHGDTQGACE